MKFKLAMIAAAAVLAGAAAHAAEPPLKVGIITSYTGPSAVNGKAVDIALDLWVKQNGDTVAGRKVEFIKRDTGGPAPDLVKRQVQELIVRDKVDLIVGIDYTPNALAAGPVSTQAKMPILIVNAATAGIIANAPYMSRFGFTTGQIAAPLGQWAVKNGIKSTIVMYADYGPGIDAGTFFKRAYAEAGGKVADEVKMPLQNPDFSAYIQRIKDAKPDGVFVFLPSGAQSNAFLKAYKDAGLFDAGIKLLATGDLTDEPSLDAIGDAAVGMITSYDYSDAHDSPMNKEWVKAYKEVGGADARPDFQAVAAWDAIHAVYDVVKAQNGKLDPDKTMELIKQVKFESPRGPIMIDPATRDIVQNVYIRRVEKRDGHLYNVEIDTIPMVTSPAGR
ncbi:MAG: transporter substrate-binding protein [Rhodospirillales bacterium]|nr:transporter substrate-binding protein [Rhodospirillales bacterium]